MPANGRWDLTWRLMGLSKLTHTTRHVVAQLVAALCYKPESRGLDSQWLNFLLT